MASLQIDSALVERISWMLTHFLWQACVIASFALMGFVLLRRSPNGQYLWGIVCFASFAICPLATYYWMQPTSNISPNTSSRSVVVTPGLDFRPTHGSSKSLSDAVDLAPCNWRDNLRDHWQVGHFLVVVVWLVGQVFVASRLVVSGYFVFRLRQTAEPVQKELSLVARRLARKMGIDCPLVATAELNGGAIAAGFVRQIIVIPTAWLADMTPEMLEAVIAHEMAHLRRYDLWLNLFQRIIETVFFFHPAVWWLSKRIRHDREVCCDLLAIQATNQRKHYAETLEHVALMESVRSELLVTNIGDDRMSLLSRVRWVLGQQPPPASFGWWPAGMLALLIPVGVIWLGYSAPTLAEQQATASEATPSEVTPSEVTRIEALSSEAVAAPELVVEPFPIHSVNVVDDHTEWKLGAYTLESPDVLRIDLEHLKPLNKNADGTNPQGNTIDEGEHLVAADGTVNLGVYGRVYVAGMSVEKATDAIRKRLAKYFDQPKVTLRLTRINSKFYYIIDKRPEQGEQIARIPATGNETVLDAISQNGGLATKMRLYIKRPTANGKKEHVLTVDWQAIVRGAKTSTNHQLLPGDRLFIENDSNDSGDEQSLSTGEQSLSTGEQSLSTGEPLVENMPTLPSAYYQLDDLSIDAGAAKLATQTAADENKAKARYRDNRQEYRAARARYERVVREFEDTKLAKEAKTRLAELDGRPDLPRQQLAERGQAERGQVPWVELAGVRNEQVRHRIPLLGAVTSKGNAQKIPPPTDDDILRCLRKLETITLPKGAQLIEKQLIADYVDPARFYPLIGMAQRHHAHYRCDIEHGGNDEGESVTQTFFIDHQHLHVCDDVTAKVRVGPKPQGNGPDELRARKSTTKTYYVGDLVIPIQKPRFTKSGEQQRVKDAKPDFDTLVTLIQSTIVPDSWDVVGGAGAIQPFEGNLSLVISQPKDIHNDVVDLLAQLRRLQESKVMLRATNLKLTKQLTEKLGIEGKPLAVLTAKEKQQILAAAKRDARARTYADLKATLFNGQFMTVALDDHRSLTIQAVALHGDEPIRVAASVGSKDDRESVATTLSMNEQSLLISMESENKEEAQHFRLVSAELLEPAKEKRILGRP